MKAEDILNIIDILPKLIIYFLPGFVFIKAIQYQFPSKKEENKSAYIYYIVLSFILISIGRIGSKKFLGYEDIYTSEFTIGIMILSIGLGYLIGQFLKSEKSIDILRKLNIYRTNSSSIFADIKDAGNGTWIKVYLNNEDIVYSGALKEFENSYDYDNTFIILSEYISYVSKKSKLDKRLLVENREKTKWVAIRVKDISRIEIEYYEKSKKVTRD